MEKYAVTDVKDQQRAELASVQSALDNHAKVASPSDSGEVSRLLKRKEELEAELLD